MTSARRPGSSNTTSRLQWTCCSIPLMLLAFSALYNYKFYANLSDYYTTEIISHTQLYQWITDTNPPSISTPLSPHARALRQLRHTTFNSSHPAASCPVQVSTWEDMGGHPHAQRTCTGSKPWGNDHKPLRVCGHKNDPTTTPFLWECRLKERLYDSIRAVNLSSCEFGFLDVGSRTGDWIIALSGFPKGVFAAMEVHPWVFLEMWRDFGANDLLEEGRVVSYPCAVGAVNETHVSDDAECKLVWGGSHFVQVSSWPGSTLCIPTGHGNDGIFQTVQLLSALGNSKCRNGEVEVPVVSIDMILADWQAPKSGNSKEKGQLAFGGLFTTKIDIEGAELEAIKSASLTFADSLQRPCQLILEMKTNDNYKEAFQTILDLGYTDVIDVDSGVMGEGAYPPKGSLYGEEGNYEFRLAGEQYEKCVERVRLATCR